MKALDINEKQAVQYCIANWLRDEQIKLAIGRVQGRIQNYDGTRSESIAIVGYGPSLRETWEKVKEFPYVMSCSGAHKFLLEKNIVPKWHVEVDPRPHKVALLGTPHSDVEYLPASACHPEYFDHLEKHGVKNIRLWHIFSNETEAIRTLPRGEWAITGGCDVGLRCITIARFFGFTDLHIFGMDGSSPTSDGGRHAGDHPNSKIGNTVEYEGREFFTTPAMLEAARQVWHELDMLGDVKPTFYGDGLIQHMAKFYIRNPAKKGTFAIAFNKPELISETYRDLNTRLHRENLAYGVGGAKHAETVFKLMGAIQNGGPVSILDYGCGKGYLGKALAEKGIPIWEYDPAVLGKEESPRAADLVVCTDVLEHIEPDKLVFVLDDLRRCVKKVGFFTIHTGPAQKTLADGRNTHLIQQNAAWWKKRLKKFFSIGRIFEVGVEIYVVVAPKQQPVRKEKPCMQEAMA